MNGYGTGTHPLIRSVSVDRNERDVKRDDPPTPDSFAEMGSGGVRTWLALRMTAGVVR